MFSARHNKSVFKYSVNADWPVLHDKDSKVKEHVERFDEVCKHISAGQGIPPADRLSLFAPTLRGNRRKLFDVILKENKEMLAADEELDYAGVFAEVLAEFQDEGFGESVVDKETKVVIGAFPCCP